MSALAKAEAGILGSTTPVTQASSRKRPKRTRDSIHRNNRCFDTVIYDGCKVDGTVGADWGRLMAHTELIPHLVRIPDDYVDAGYSPCTKVAMKAS
jgi:hypothetical protein